MFLGFPLLRSLSAFPLSQVTLDEFMENYLLGGKQEVDLNEAKLLDTYNYEVNGIHYEEKVYRLKSGSLYTTTTSNNSATLKQLRHELGEAVRIQDFEKAAILRDKINAIK